MSGGHLLWIIDRNRKLQSKVWFSFVSFCEEKGPIFYNPPISFPAYGPEQDSFKDASRPSHCRCIGWKWTIVIGGVTLCYVTWPIGKRSFINPLNRLQNPFSAAPDCCRCRLWYSVTARRSYRGVYGFGNCHSAIPWANTQPGSPLRLRASIQQGRSRPR